jgi:pilus assembly protein CpaE
METKPISVLIIDNDVASRNYLTVMMQKNGYSVTAVSQGREGMVLAWKDLPDIIILDPALPDMPGLEMIKRLRQDHRTLETPCIALGSRQESQEINDLLQAGCNEYIAKSSQALPHLLELIPRILQDKSVNSKKRGILLAFLSAKGGVGTSSLCANIAMCLGSEKIETRVAVVDMVLPIGSIAGIVGYDDRLNLITATKQDPSQLTPVYFKNNLPRIPNWYFHLLSGSPDPDSANQLVVDNLERIFSSIMESYDYILVDIGRTLSRISLPIIQKADVVALIVGSDLSTATLTQTVWEYLKNHGVDQRRLYLLQNRAVGLEGLTKAELEQVTNLQIQITMPHMAAGFTLANNRHEPVLAKYPNDSSVFVLKQAALEIAELGKTLHSQ